MGINYLIFYLYIQTKNAINSLLTSVTKSLKSDLICNSNCNSDTICNSLSPLHNITQPLNISQNKYKYNTTNNIYYELNDNYHQQTNCHDFYYNLYQNPRAPYFPGWNDNISYCMNELANNYIIGKQIGKGMYSNVYYGQNILKRKIYAIKITKYKSNAERLRFIKENKYQSLYSQIKCYLCFDNYYKNEIISIWDCYIHTLNSIIPFIKHFNSNIIKKEEIVGRIIYKILNKLLYLHSNDIIHHDLKPENILITCTNINNNFDVFIIDYGFSECTQSYLYTEKNRIIPRYTLMYCCWELLQCIDGKKRGQIKYNNKIDMYALGIITMELLLNGNNIIFNNKNRNNYIKTMSNNIIKKRNIGIYEQKHFEKQYKQFLRGLNIKYHRDYWKDNNNENKSIISQFVIAKLQSIGYSVECLHFVAKLLEDNPNERLNAKQCLNHPFIFKYNFNNKIY